MATRLDVITGMPALDRLRRDWEAVYDADPEAQFFLSWPWMSSRLRRSRMPWIVLAVRPEADPSSCVAFLPLTLRLVKTRGGPRRELRTAGSPVADYAGFLCRPGHEQPALAALAAGLLQLRSRLRWDHLNLDGIRASDERLKLFLSRFAPAGFTATVRRPDNGDGIDNTICPYVDLPGDWDAYLAGSVGANTRQKIRRFLRRVDGAPGFSVTHATAETLEEDIAALLRLWEMQWAGRKAGLVNQIRAQSSAMLMHAFADGQLILPILRWNGAPVAALAILIDHAKRSYLFYKGGRDPSFTDLPPGFCLHAHSIRHAIQRGFRTYDFLRGDEAYKFLFGAKQHPISYILVRERAGDGAGVARVAAASEAREHHRTAQPTI